MSTGRLGSIGIGAETTFGTGVAPTAFFNATESITETRGRLREGMNFGTRARQPADDGRLRIAGAINGIHARPDNLGHLLRAALGAPQTSGAGPYDHVFKPATAKFSAEAALPPYSATVKRNATSIHRYAGGQLNRLVLNQPVDDALTIDTDWLFKSVSVESDTLMALETKPRFRFNQLAVELGGSSWDALRSFRLTIDNALDPEETLNASKEISGVDFGDSNITAEVTAVFKAKELYDEFVANTTLDLVLTWTNGGDILEISLPRLNVESWQAPISGPGRMEVTANLVAEFDAVAGHELEITLTNGTATY